MSQKLQILVLAGCLSLKLVIVPAAAQNTGPDQTPAGNDQRSSQSVPLGLLALPQGPLPVGLQSPVPSSAQSRPKPDHPLVVSPPLKAISGFLNEHPLTMREAVAVALYTNRNFALAEAQLVQVHGRTGQARSQRGLQAGINADLTYFDDATTADLSAFGGGGAGSPSAFVITPQFNPTVTGSITLPIDVTGVIRAAVNQAEFAEVAARIDVNRVRNQIVYDVKTAFYNALRAQAQYTVAMDNLNNSIARLNDANRQFASGIAPKFDVITAERDVAVSQQGVIDARSQISLSLAALKNTMGIDIRSPLILAETDAVEYPPGVSPAPVVPAVFDVTPPVKNPDKPLQDIQTKRPVPVPAIPPVDRPASNVVTESLDFGPEFDKLIDEAMKTRPEILEEDAQIAAAHKGVIYARRSSDPSLSLTVSDMYSANAAGFTRKNVGAATLGIRIPVFDAGLAKSRVEEARGAVAVAEVNRRTAVDRTMLDVQQAYITLLQARSRIVVANASVAQAIEAARLARVRYVAGVAALPTVSPQLELSNAQSTLAQAQSNQVNALYDYNNARAQLDRAVGRYGFAGTTPGYTSVPSPTVRGVQH